ncbi:hypothetical protein ABW48_23700 [Pluralibacter gergoviae]|jgi:hypothetical protein|nr:hypothetical protein SEEA7928_02293 [Salmonella enterica subsp. enterica serovar Agona str. 557928]KLP89082.1 hypothetical protein ABR37_18330 [Enterobacter hormaechei subsp. hoffmannii]KOQ87158.1 hypothetical protein ABW48_23700 [Pluralibacter gergoviae]
MTKAGSRQIAGDIKMPNIQSQDLPAGFCRAHIILATKTQPIIDPTGISFNRIWRLQQTFL